MPKVKAEIAGKILTLLGYDGTDFCNVSVDAAGRLRVNLTVTTPGLGLATEANQALLLAELADKLETGDLDLDGDGKLAVLNFGYTGVAWFPLLIDALGHLQVDAVTCGLPAGAATNATLATLATEAKLELCRLLLVSLDTELALHAKQTETQPVSALSLPLPTGAATSAAQASLLTELQLKANLNETQPVSAASELGHYISQIMQRNFTLSAAAGANLLTGAGPSAGEVWVVTGLTAYNDINDEDGVFMGVFDGVNYNWVNSCGTVTAKTMLSWTGEIVLVNGDTPRCYHLGCTLNDDIYFFVYGYKRET